MLLEDLLKDLYYMQQNEWFYINKGSLDQVVGFLGQLSCRNIDTRDIIVEKLIQDDKIKELEENFEEPITISNKEELRKFVLYLTGEGNFPKECSAYVYRQQEIEELLKDLLNKKEIGICGDNIIEEFIKAINDLESKSKNGTELKHLDFDGQVNNTEGVGIDDKYSHIKESVMDAISDVFTDNYIKDSESNINLILNKVDFEEIKYCSPHKIYQYVGDICYNLKDEFEYL